WLLALDADERLEPQDAIALSTHTCDDSIAAYSVAVRRYVDSITCRTWETAARPNPICVSETLDSFPAYMQSTQARLFQRTSVAGFEETASDAIELKMTGALISECRGSFRIHKIPAQSEQILAMRRRSGQIRIKQDENDAIAIFRQGVLEYEEFADYPVALGHFRDACI